MKNNVFNGIRIMVVAVACISFTYASYSLTKSYLGYQNSSAAYDEINQMFMQSDDTVSAQQGQGDDAAKDDKTDDKANGLEYTKEEKKWVWDYDAMLEYNPEALGYIKLADSRIQYPIVQHSDNDYYLSHGSNRIYNGNGAIFIDSRIPGGLDARSCIIYGHDMLDGSMFAGLLDFAKTEFCDTHQVFDVYVGYRHYRYYVFASFRADATDEDIYKLGFKDNQDYGDWIGRCMGKSNYRYPVARPDVNDKTLLLSTCIDDDNLRFVVALVRGEEVVD